MFLRILFSLLFVSNAAIASPWWTGPLLAAAGRTIPPGHINIEPYGFFTLYPQHYRNVETVPFITIGVTNFIDMQTSLPFDYSWDQGQSGYGIADYSLGAGFQIMKEEENNYVPYVRLTLQEIFPTGRFQNLNANKLGTDQTGTGAYQTAAALNFQKTFEFKDHYLRARLNLITAYASNVIVHGVNAYGGGPDTVGKVSPGSSYTADVAFEYTLTQNWVPVFEVVYAESRSTSFNGNPGLTPAGVVSGVGGGGGRQVSLAPAIEYNFSPNVGIIGGVWFSVSGKPASQFTAFTVALNYYF